MDRYLGTPYWGDPGVPHGGNFFLVWCGAAAFSAVNAASSFMPKIPKQNSQDKALVSEQHLWKKALKKNESYLSEKKTTKKKKKKKIEPYKFKRNQIDKEVRNSYYFNSPVIFFGLLFLRSYVSFIILVTKFSTIINVSLPNYFVEICFATIIVNLKAFIFGIA